MAAKFVCERPNCGKRFGIVRRAKRHFSTWWRNTHYCSELCLRLHTAQITAEANRRKQWLAFLSK